MKFLVRMIARLSLASVLGALGVILGVYLETKGIFLPKHLLYVWGGASVMGSLYLLDWAFEWGIR